MQERLDAVEDRLECNAERVAEFADGDVDCDCEDRLDDLRLGEVIVKTIPKLLGKPIGIDTNLHRKVQQCLFSIGEMRARFVAVVSDIGNFLIRYAHPFGQRLMLNHTILAIVPMRGFQNDEFLGSGNACLQELEVEN